VIGLILLVAGLVLWLATNLVTLGIVLTIIGGVLVATHALLIIGVIVFAVSTGKKVRFKL